MPQRRGGPFHSENELIWVTAGERTYLLANYLALRRWLL